MPDTPPTSSDSFHKREEWRPRYLLTTAISLTGCAASLGLIAADLLIATHPNTTLLATSLSIIVVVLLLAAKVLSEDSGLLAAEIAALIRHTERLADMLHPPGD